jgi:hypothetical protein
MMTRRAIINSVELKPQVKERAAGTSSVRQVPPLYAQEMLMHAVSDGHSSDKFDVLNNFLVNSQIGVVLSNLSP